MMALVRQEWELALVPSLLWVSARSQPWGHSLVLPLTPSSSSDIGDVGLGVNYYRGNAEAKVTST